MERSLYTNMTNQEFVYQLLKFLASHDSADAVWWKPDGEGLLCLVNCNDEFFWGCSDYEEITQENFPVLVKAFEDAILADSSAGDIYAPLLFCCRVRGMRPQGACYPSAKALWPLIDACGPEREVGFGNPYAPGTYRNK